MPKHVFDKLSFPARVGISAGAGAMFALACSLLFALIASMSANPSANLTLYGEICFLTSMAFCGFFGAKMGDDSKFLCGIAAGGTMLAAVVMLALLFSSGGIVKALILSTLGMFMCAVGAAVGSREVKRKRRR